MSIQQEAIDRLEKLVIEERNITQHTLDQLNAAKAHIASLQAKYTMILQGSDIARARQTCTIIELKNQLKAFEKKELSVRNKEIELVKKAMNVLNHNNGKLRKRNTKLRNRKR